MFYRLGQGMLLPLRSARLLAGAPTLWPFALAPALINVIVFLCVAAVMAWYTPTIVDWIWPRLDAWSAWYWEVLWYAVAAIVVALVFIFSYLTALLIGSIVASPFNDVLSERSETILMARDQVPEREESLVRGAIRAIVSTLVVMGSYLAVMAPIVLLNLIPGVGSVLATVLGTGVSALFLTLEYADAPLDRRGHDLREKFELLDRHRALSFGFGLGASLLFWIPLLNFVTIPVAVVGGTALAIALSEQRSSEE
jgi:CysZ protein